MVQLFWKQFGSSSKLVTQQIHFYVYTQENWKDIFHKNDLYTDVHSIFITAKT